MKSQCMTQNYKITTLTSVPLASPIFTDDKLITSSSQEITFPTNGGGLVTENGIQTLTNKTLTTPTIASILNSSATITVPSTSGTLALQAEVVAQKERIDRLLDYLESWINAGSLSMSDVKASVDPSA